MQYHITGALNCGPREQRGLRLACSPFQARAFNEALL
jgi:hypothetical protein